MEEVDALSVLNAHVELYARLRTGIGSRDLRSLSGGKGLPAVFVELYDAAARACGWSKEDIMRLAKGMQDD